MSADIDIDFVDRTQAIAVLNPILASRIVELSDQGLKITPHNSGVYFQKIPHDPITNCATVPYKEADTRGYFKIDFLNVSVYDGVRDEEHLVDLLNRKPMWELLQEEEFSNSLFHINGHSEILKKFQPTSIEELAIVIALVRPGKRHLISKSMSEIKEEIWKKPEDGEYYFKKSHAISYATAIVVQMNLLIEYATT